MSASLLIFAELDRTLLIPEEYAQEINVWPSDTRVRFSGVLFLKLVKSVSYHS